MCCSVIPANWSTRFIPCQTLSYNSLLAMFLFGSTMVILAPIMEELYFREIMLDHFLVEKKMTRAGAITLSAILFFLPHLFNENLSFEEKKAAAVQPKAPPANDGDPARE